MLRRLLLRAAQQRQFEILFCCVHNISHLVLLSEKVDVDEALLLDLAGAAGVAPGPTTVGAREDEEEATDAREERERFLRAMALGKRRKNF